MELPQRKKFKTIQDWHDFLAPVVQGKDGLASDSLLKLRRACYSDIEKLRGRPLFVYATKFFGTIPSSAIPNLIDLEDIEGFTDMVNSVSEETKEIDVLIHSPGGKPDATERIVGILRNKFDKVHFLIPHSAYSAATMLALSGDSIVMHPSATLGPIDPQIGGIPARSIKRGFEKIKEKITKEGPESLPAYIPLLEKYTIELLEICEDSEKLSKELVTTWLREYMLADKKGTAQIIENAVDYFSNYDIHLLHSRPLSFKKLQTFGLKIEVADEDLQKLLWEAYILINGFFDISSFVKLFETTSGVSWGKQMQQVFVKQPPQA